MTIDEANFIGAMNMCDEISNEEYKKIMCHCEEYEPCEDAISREAVDKYLIKLMSGYLYEEERERLEEFSAYIWELPSVTPQPKLGKWINIDATHSQCDKCGSVFEITSANGEANYCPNCGTKNGGRRMNEQWVVEAERNAKDLAERMYEQIAEEADYIDIDRKWYLEKVVHYMRAESEDKG